MSNTELSTRSLGALALAARLVLAGVFAWAALPKLADPHAFAVAIDNYRVLPPAVVGPVALFLPGLELVVALALVLGPYVRGAAALSSLLLLVFAAAMVQAKARGIDLDCGCFGAAAKAQVTWWTVGRNLALCALGFALAFSRRVPARGLDALVHRARPTG